MKKLLVITVDCDLRSDSIKSRQATLDALLTAFEDTGAAGKITWFINENDFHLTENHELFLQETLLRKDTIGTHDHVDFIDGKMRQDALFERFARTLRIVGAWLKQNGGNEHVPYHRMGCLYQRKESYQALARLGYEVISEVYPGYKMPDRAEEDSFDNQAIPPATLPYRHDSDNFLEYHSTIGRFLQMPVFHMFLRDLDFNKLQEWITLGERENYAAYPFVWIFHPYEICAGRWEEGLNQVDPDKVKTLKENIRRFVEEYDLELANFQTCHQIFGE